MHIQELKDALKNAVDNRIKLEARALRGTVSNGMFRFNSKTYPFKLAVDCNINNGRRVWAQLTPNGTAVIIGA